MAELSYCVFCGSRHGVRPAYAAAAAALGKALVGRRLGLVYGGGNVGLMGVIADSVLAAGGRVTGVIPHGLEVREVGHPSLSELLVVDSMHERKHLMSELSSGFVALPGGIGTFEELFEISAWAQLGMHRKPVALLNVAGYYDRLLAMLDHAVGEGFVESERREQLIVDDEPDRLLDRMAGYDAPNVPRWLGSKKTELGRHRGELDPCDAVGDTADISPLQKGPARKRDASSQTGLPRGEA